MAMVIAHRQRRCVGLRHAAAPLLVGKTKSGSGIPPAQKLHLEGMLMLMLIKLLLLLPLSDRDEDTEVDASSIRPTVPSTTSVATEVSANRWRTS